MTGEIVHGAPEHTVLRDRDEQPAAGPHHAKQLAEHTLVVVDVLEHVEDTDRIIRPRQRKTNCISSNERYVWQPRPRDPQPFGVEIRSGQAEVRPPGVEFRQHEAIAATDLEKTSDLRQIAAERPLDQTAA